MNETITIEVCKDGWTKGLQLSVGNGSHGYRLAGPKFNGSSELLLKTDLDERDATEIRAYLDQGFPVTAEGERRAALQAAVSAVVDLQFSLPAGHPDRSGLQAALVLLSALRDGTTAPAART